MPVREGFQALINANYIVDKYSLYLLSLRNQKTGYLEAIYGIYIL